MPFEIQDLGITTNIEVIQSLVPLAGLHVADVGCGNLGFTKQVAEFARSVLAIDPDPLQAQSNRNAQYPANIEFVETSAVSIPGGDKSLDGIFFAYSLHHVEAASYSKMYSELSRVLKPDGFMYVIEPIDGPLNQVMRLFHDEEVERAAAQAWLESIADDFQSVYAAEYHGYTQYESFDHYTTQN